MKKIFQDNETVFIKTYCFESGLWYLAKSLGDLLQKQGHKVYYIPKSKYQMLSASFTRTYLNPSNPEDFSELPILKMTSKQTINEQLHKYIVKYNAKYLISFETLMEKASWISVLKARFRDNLKVIDVPMAEWVNPRYLGAHSYRLFDEIWALNKLTEEIFKDEDNVRKISWDFVDHSLFNLEDREKSEQVRFLHLSSTNPDYSSKNTLKVIKAFDRFISAHNPNATLYIQGGLPKKLPIDVEKHTNIISNSKIISRLEISNLYKKADCIIAPSSREGLSLSLYEGLASGCKIITTDAEPMNYINTPYLCEVEGIKRDKSIVPLSQVNETSLYKNILRVYQELSNE